MSIEIQIGANIGGVDKAVAKVGDSLQGIQTVAQQANTNLTQLGNGITNAGKGLKDVSPVAQKAQNTLTGLSGVVRDLPFGFIAIQNNLPILADQFTALTKESGGVGGALKGLGGALIGPAGIAFAFGAVTSIITGLIQEYGSLGEAINVILGITKPLTEAQKAYNKASFEAAGNVAAEEAKVAILTKRLLDSKAPQADRLAAYGELKKVAPDVVAGIKDENALTDASNILIAANSKLRAESVRLKVQEAGITAALTTNETKIAELRAKLVKADAKYVESAKALNTAKQQAIITGFGSVTAEEAALKAFNNSANAVSQLQAQISVLTGESQTYLNQLDPVVLGLSKINEQTREQIKGLKKSNKETKEATNNSKERVKAIDTESDAIARSIRVGSFFSNYDSKGEAKNIIGNIQKSLKSATTDKTGVQIPVSFPTVNPAGILSAIKLSTEEFAKLKKEANLQAATTLLQDTFFNPVANLFSYLISGADGAFKAFTKAVLQAINQIVAKIIATGIISLLANLISGGTAGLGKAVLGDVLGSFGFGIGKVANPNFGGITSGGMQMSGAVNVVLRGQDLVGSLNRTNAQINRVG